MKRAFVLEDAKYRTDWFREELGGFIEFSFHDNVISAEDSFDPPYDLILLDHDLGSIGPMTSDFNSGTTFVLWLVKKFPSVSDTPVIIHSHNTPAAERMEMFLVRAGFTDVTVITFGQMMGEWERGTFPILGRYRFDGPETEDGENPGDTSEGSSHP